MVEELGKPLQIFKVDSSIVVNFHETTVEILSNHRSFGTQKIVITYPTFVSFLGILPLSTRWLANSSGYCSFLNQNDSIQFDPEEITRFAQRLGSENIGIIGDIQAATGNYHGKYFSHVWLGETYTKSQANSPSLIFPIKQRCLELTSQQLENLDEKSTQLLDNISELCENHKHKKHQKCGMCQSLDAIPVYHHVIDIDHSIAIPYKMNGSIKEGGNDDTDDSDNEGDTRDGNEIDPIPLLEKAENLIRMFCEGKSNGRLCLDFHGRNYPPNLDEVDKLSKKKTNAIQNGISQADSWKKSDGEEKKKKKKSKSNQHLQDLALNALKRIREADKKEEERDLETVSKIPEEEEVNTEYQVKRAKFTSPFIDDEAKETTSKVHENDYDGDDDDDDVEAIDVDVVTIEDCPTTTDSDSAIESSDERKQKKKRKRAEEEKPMRKSQRIVKFKSPRLDSDFRGLDLNEAESRATDLISRCRNDADIVKIENAMCEANSQIADNSGLIDLTDMETQVLDL